MPTKSSLPLALFCFPIAFRPFSFPIVELQGIIQALLEALFHDRFPSVLITTSQWPCRGEASRHENGEHLKGREMVYQSLVGLYSNKSQAGVEAEMVTWCLRTPRSSKTLHQSTRTCRPSPVSVTRPATRTHVCIDGYAGTVNYHAGTSFIPPVLCRFVCRLEVRAACSVRTGT
jgi:hypothetical protein